MKRDNGITLIALIITVIVLLILAGTAVSIAVNSGDIFSKASTAREEWNYAVAKEEGELTNLINILNQVSGERETAEAAGLQPDGSFIGLKSIGKQVAGEIDNIWKDATPVIVGGNDGYKFTAGHFLHVTNCSGFLWDEATGSFEYKTVADAYLCWNADYGTITSEQDFRDCGCNADWDIFDSASGEWLGYNYNYVF